MGILGVHGSRADRVADPLGFVRDQTPTAPARGAVAPPLLPGRRRRRPWPCRVFRCRSARRAGRHRGSVRLREVDAARLPRRARRAVRWRGLRQRSPDQPPAGAGARPAARPAHRRAVPVRQPLRAPHGAPEHPARPVARRRPALPGQPRACSPSLGIAGRANALPAQLSGGESGPRRAGCRARQRPDGAHRRRADRRARQRERGPPAGPAGRPGARRPRRRDRQPQPRRHSGVPTASITLLDGRVVA